MQIIRIRSAHDLTARAPEARRSGKYNYSIHCAQFGSQRRDWEESNSQADLVRCMTLSMDLIYLTEAETRVVAEAIQESRAAVDLP